MKKVFVTGGTGFLGTCLVKALLKEKFDVVVYDLIKPLQKIKGVRYIIGDVTCYSHLKRAMSGSDVVFHLAAIPSIARSQKHRYFEINVRGTENVLESSKKLGVKKVVYLSSSTVYGVPKKFPLSESDSLSYVGPYSKSKIIAEKTCRRYSKDGLSVSIVRPRVILGKGRRGIFSLLFDRILENKPVYLIGNGKNVFQFSSVCDVVSVLILCSEKPESDVYNVGCSDKTNVRTILKQLIKKSGSSSKIIKLPSKPVKIILGFADLFKLSPLVKEQYAIADKTFFLDTSKAQKDLGFKSSQTNYECILEAFSEYRKNKPKKQFNGLLGVFGFFKTSNQGSFQKI